MTMSKTMAEGLKLRARLAKLADSTDEKIASKALSDLKDLYVQDRELDAREDKIMPLRAEIVELKRKVAVADEALAPVTEEREALLAEVSTLREETVKSGPLREQLDKMIAENADWKKEQHKLLVAENQQYAWRSERAENAAKETIEANRRLFSSSGQEALMSEIARLFAVHNIPMPDIWNLPKGTNPLLLTLWGWSSIKSQYFVALTQRYPEPSDAFRQFLIKHLTAGLPIRGAMPDPIEHLPVKLEILRLMCSRWPGVMESAQRQVDEVQAQERAQAMLNNNLRLADQQTELARRGYGRDPIRVEAKNETADPGRWSGFIPANPEWNGSDIVRPLEDEDGPSIPFEDR